MNTLSTMYRTRKHSRHGAAAVEAALLLPLLVILTFGALDLAQYVNLSQLVANASREAARVASRSDTQSTQDVINALGNYMAECFPQLSPATITNAMTITVRDQYNQPIPNGDLTTIESGDPIALEVSFDFDAVRWLSGPQWNGNISECRTVCRRE